MHCRALLLASACIVLSGCADKLNSEIEDHTVSSVISMPTSPCGSSPRSITQMARALNQRDLEGVKRDFSETKASDMEIGAALIEAAAANAEFSQADLVVGRSRNELHSDAVKLSSELGFNLAQFAGESLDNDGASKADEAIKTGAPAELVDYSVQLQSEKVDHIPVSKSGWQDAINTIALTTVKNGWTSAFATSLGKFARNGGSVDTQEDLTKKYILAAYFAAYFRNGQIFSLTFDDTKLKQEFVDKLKDTIKNETELRAAEGELDGIADDFRKLLCAKGQDESGNCIVVGVIGEQTFVTRAGKSYGFPGITATIDVTSDKKVSTNKLDENQIASDLVRVFVEALGDMAFKVPGEPKSTLCSSFAELCGTEDLAPKLQKADTWGDMAEGSTQLIVGPAVRGGWLFSLNNDALADIISTALAVSARKSAEFAAWEAQKGCRAPDGRSARITYQELPLEFTK